MEEFKHLEETVTKTFKGIEIEYVEVFHLNYAVDENTGKIDYSKKEKFYTKDQMDKNRIEVVKAFLAKTSIKA